MGVGSSVGKGYVVDIKMVTLEKIPDRIREEIKDLVQEKLRQLLPTQFPETDLLVDKDGPVLKIHGDLSLGDV